jgi:hypothetical protein
MLGGLYNVSFVTSDLKKTKWMCKKQKVMFLFYFIYNRHVYIFIYNRHVYIFIYNRHVYIFIYNRHVYIFIYNRHVYIFIKLKVFTDTMIAIVLYIRTI